MSASESLPRLATWAAEMAVAVRQRIAESAKGGAKVSPLTASFVRHLLRCRPKSSAKAYLKRRISRRQTDEGRRDDDVTWLTTTNKRR